MKVVFLLDNSEYVEVAPDKLQIRQLSAGVAALGTEVTVPLKKEDGTPDLNEDGSPKTQLGFRPFINYNVNLSIPQPAEAAPALTAPAAVEVVKAAKNQSKKNKAATRKAN